MEARRDDNERIATNESAFRRVNEGIERGRSPVASDERVGFVCECARLGCTELVEVSIADYEAIRSHPRRFLIATGHEVEGEHVVSEAGGMAVVEKDGAAGRIAEARDPRC